MIMLIKCCGNLIITSNHYAVHLKLIQCYMSVISH